MNQPFSVAMEYNVQIDQIVIPTARLKISSGQAHLTTYGMSAAGLEVRVDDKVIDLCDAQADAIPSNILLSQNQLANADLSQTLNCWVIHTDKEAKVKFGINFNKQWTCKDHNTGYAISLDQDAVIELAYCDPVDKELLPVVPGAIYQASGYFGVYRCKAEIVIEFYNAAKKLLSEATDVVANIVGGRSISDYKRAVVTTTAPEGAAYVRFVMRKRPLDAENYIFFLRLWLGCVPNNAVQEWAPAAWNPEEMAALRRCGGSGQALIVPLPSIYFDGQPHEVSVIDRASGGHVFGSPQMFSETTEVTGKIEALDGTVVVGWVRKALGGPVELSFAIDGIVIGTGIADKQRGNNVYDIRLPIPRNYCDGRPHRFTVRAAQGGALIGEIAEVSPAFLTPWNVLQQHAGANLPAPMAPAATHRYQNIRDWLNTLTHAEGAERAALLTRLSHLGFLHELLVEGFEKRRQFTRFALPEVKSPLVSVVVPVHNNFAVTYNCLVALAFAFNKASFEVIVVDDGSSDETRSLTDIVANVVYVRNDAAQGFIRACNLGASNARGQYVVFLNNDTEPSSRWLDELLFAFDAFEGVGMAGAKLLYADGKLQEAGGIVWNTGNPWNYGRGANARAPQYNYTRQADYLSGAAVMLPRTVWDVVGGFSEEFCPAYFEDTDLAFKVRAQGLKTVYAPMSVVYHFEGMSNGTSTASGIKRYQEINRPKFKRKWAAACRFNGEEGKDVDLNKDRGILHRALVIDAEPPRPDTDAGSYAAIQEMRLLQGLGFKLTFAPLNLAYLGAYTERLQRMGVEAVYAPFTTSIEELLIERGREFDVVYVTRYNVAQQVLETVRRLAPQAKILFCNADLHFLRELREAIATNNQDALLDALTTRDQELEVMRWVDVTLSYNTTEHAVIMSHNLASTKVAMCPWVVDVVDDVPGFDARQDVAFLGGFGHPPNRSAVLFFIQEVMPLLCKRVPGLRFRIYGSRVPDEIRALASENVLVEGYVEDVADVYNSCRVFVAPLLTGAGIKGKVIDGLAYGAPSVLSPIAAEGTGVRQGVDALVAETPDDWADAVARLYTDCALWEDMSKNSREQARAIYSFDKGKSLMRKALEAVGIYVPHDNAALVPLRARL